MGKKGLKAVFLGFRCHYCGEKATTKDHYIPTALGGTSDVNNLVPACNECNLMKDKLIPEAFFAFCQDVVTNRPPKYDRFRSRAKAILLKHVPELLDRELQ